MENIRSETDIEVVEIDELHTYIGKKTPVGYGLLLIDMAKDSSISLLATGHHKQESNYGKVCPKGCPWQKLKKWGVS